MKLHDDKNAFKIMIDKIHDVTGFRTDVIEKDYYVVLILEELAELQKKGLLAFFKGGTALYKALKTTNRFSEDIDISVDTRNCNRTQNDKRLEMATKKYKSLSRDISSGKTNRSEIVSVYNYEPITVFDREDSLQRFGKLKIEATSFTISEPVEDIGVSTLIYDYANTSEKQTLETLYEVKPFYIKTIKLERIFIDKLFAAEAYVRKSDIEYRAFEAAKHIYDLAILENNPKIINLIADVEQMKRLLEIRIKEEKKRLDGIPNVMPLDFIFFTDAIKNDKVKKAYEAMQNQYVFRKCDRIDYDVAIMKLNNIKLKLLNNLAWIKCGN